MNADTLNKLPRYIEAPGGGMWGPMPEGFRIDNADAIFVRLRDVEALVCPVAPENNQFRSVGYGSYGLRILAKECGWNLHLRGSGGLFSDGWSGDDSDNEYFIKE